jgi:hypothetical protein
MNRMNTCQGIEFDDVGNTVFITAQIDAAGIPATKSSPGRKGCFYRFPRLTVIHLFVFYELFASFLVQIRIDLLLGAFFKDDLNYADRL